jgi:hypothetical protein
MSSYTADDYAAEVRGAELARAERERFFAARPPARRWRDVQVVSARPAGPRPGGRALVSRRPAEVQRDYETVVWQETHLPVGLSRYDALVSGACQLLEHEAAELLAAPLRPHAVALAAATRARGTRQEGAAVALEKWGAREWLTTLGITSMALAGLRRGLGQGDDRLAAAAAAAFHPGLLELIRSNDLARALDGLAADYRNPVCHRRRDPKVDAPWRPFDAAEYAAFARRLVGAARTADWDRDGPDPDPPAAAAGLLHHLLTGSRLLPPAGAAVDRLTALARPRPGAFGLEVVPYPPESGRRYRDVTVEDARGGPGFRLGGEVAFRVAAGRDCHLTLVDVGTSGAVTVLVPNVLCPAPVLSAGRAEFFPGPVFGEFALRLTGRAGRERVVAVGTADPLPHPPVPPGGVFAALDPAEVAGLAAAVEQLPPAVWSAAACEFVIEEGL